MQKQCRLRQRREPLQIPYPETFPDDQKSGYAEDETLLIGTEPRWLTPQEIAVVEEYLKGLPYPQQIDMTGAVLIDPDDPLLNASHEDLDSAESAAQQQNTRYLPVGGGQRSIRERVLIMRERGYQGNGKIAISAGA